MIFLFIRIPLYPLPLLLLLTTRYPKNICGRVRGSLPAAEEESSYPRTKRRLR